METVLWILGVVLVIGFVAYIRNRKTSDSCDDIVTWEETPAQAPTVMVAEPVAKASKAPAKKAATKKVAKKGKK